MSTLQNLARVCRALADFIDGPLPLLAHDVSAPVVRVLCAEAHEWLRLCTPGSGPGPHCTCCCIYCRKCVNKSDEQRLRETQAIEESST